MIEEKKDNKNLIIGVLIGLVIALSIALVYLLFIKKDDGKNNQPSPSVTPIATPTPSEDINELSDYILNQKISKIEIKREDCDNEKYDTIELNTSQLKEILNDLNGIKFTKEITGGAGASCVDSLLIQYTKGGESYNIEVLSDLIWIGQDKELEIVLDKKSSNLNNKTCENDECIIQYNLDKKISFNKYFK